MEACHEERCPPQSPSFMTTTSRSESGTELSSPSSSSFRSVLPHEPLPSNELRGYLHVQGAFTPRQQLATCPEKPASETELHAARQEEIGEEISSSSPSTKASFWTRESLHDTLQELVPLALCLTTTSLSPSQSQPAFPPLLDIQVIDSVPPFTKVRLEFASTHEAYWVMTRWKQMQMSPHQLFHTMLKNDHHNNMPLPFSTRPFQLTLLTTQPLPPLDVAWNRSSPPKFRRLLARSEERHDPHALQALEHERQTTRMVFVTNLVHTAAQKDGMDDHGDEQGIVTRTNYNSDNDTGQTSSLLWNDPHCVAQALRSVLTAFDRSGLGIEIFVASHKKLTQYCHVGMRSAEDAQDLVRSLQDQQVTWHYTHAETGVVYAIQSGRLFLDYAGMTHRSVSMAKARSSGHAAADDPECARKPPGGGGEPTRSECTSTTDHVTLPGLLLVPDFVTEQEEETLVAVLTGPHAPWAPRQDTPTTGGKVKRKVQHYGYVYDYQTADVLRHRNDPKAACPELPALSPELLAEQQSVSAQKDEDAAAAVITDFRQKCVEEGDGWNLLAAVIEKARQFNFDLDGGETTTLQCPTLNQLTVNQYEPGQGIGSHVESLAFGNALMSLSLNSGITMEFRKVKANDDGEKDSKKLLYLPRRSLLLLSGAARYEWEHMIVGRMTDTHNGEVLRRGLRVSLTLRTALESSIHSSLPLPRVETRTFPPEWKKRIDPGGNNQSSSLVTPDCERDHVHAVYDAIATQWHHTRGRRGVLWPGATQFLKALPAGSVVADVGCGDGKYFPAIWEAGSFVIGTDISLPLLRTAFGTGYLEEAFTPDTRRVSDHRHHLQNRPAVAVADCMHVPLRTSSCDAAICIAVLHHLSTFERRKRCIEELARIVKPGGLINVQAWAMEQEEGSRRKFVASDVYVPFNVQPKFLKLADATHSTKGECDASVQENSNKKSTPRVYSEAFNADYDDEKGLVVFKRYCHLYKRGELENIVSQVLNVVLVESGFETGNYFVILRVS